MSKTRTRSGARTGLLAAVVLGAGVISLVGSGGGGGDSLAETITLSAEAVGPAQVNLSWSPHPDLVTGYFVYRDGASITDVFVAGTALSDSGVSPQTRYCYVVYAYVALYGNVGRSNNVCVDTPVAGEGWSIESIGPGDAPDLVIANEIANVVYYNGALMHASNAGESWQINTVDPSAGTDPTVAADSTGALHVAYGDASDFDLKYAANPVGEWAEEIVDSQGDTGFSPALAIDNTDTVHMSYHVWWDGQVASCDLIYAYGAGGAWTIDTVGRVATNGGDTAIGADSQGKAHISYIAGDLECSVVYATNTSGDWESQALGRCPLGHGYTAIVVDNSDRVHVVYHAYQSTAPTFALVYATNSSGQWVNVPIDSFDWIAGDLALALDTDGHVHISYADHNASLKYASNSNGTWVTQFIDVDTAANAIALGADNAVHIVYATQSGSIRYAAKN